MDRRDFLKSIGLAGVALTLPKPLSVVAAKISDLKDPPIHAGYASFKIDRTFIWNDLIWHYPVGMVPTMQDYKRFSSGTSVSVFLGRRHDETAKITSIVHVPTSHIPSFLEWKKGHGYGFAHGIYLAPGEEIEIWCIPHKTPMGDPGKLLPIEWIIQGMSTFELDPHPAGINKSRLARWCFMRKMELVRVERARAIELGLVTPGEPEETFQI